METHRAAHENWRRRDFDAAVSAAVENFGSSRSSGTRPRQTSTLSTLANAMMHPMKVGVMWLRPLRAHGGPEKGPWEARRALFVKQVGIRGPDGSRASNVEGLTQPQR